MPLYEYHCDACDSEFEKRRAIKDADAPIECPECESAEVTRKVSLFIAMTRSDSGKASLGASGGGCCSGGACACSGHMN
jgi:putative FmdB family regulatory protein